MCFGMGPDDKMAHMMRVKKSVRSVMSHCQAASPAESIVTKARKVFDGESKNKGFDAVVYSLCEPSTEHQQSFGKAHLVKIAGLPCVLDPLNYTREDSWNTWGRM